MSDILAVNTGNFLDPYTSGRLLDLANDFVLAYNMLMSISLARDRLHYNPIFKLHHVIHIADFSKFLHPRLTWSYIFEDFVGRVKKLAVACYHGCPLHRIPAKIAAQYVFALALAVDRHR